MPRGRAGRRQGAIFRHEALTQGQRLHPGGPRPYRKDGGYRPPEVPHTRRQPQGAVTQAETAQEANNASPCRRRRKMSTGTSPATAQHTGLQHSPAGLSQALRVFPAHRAFLGPHTTYHTATGDQVLMGRGSHPSGQAPLTMAP